MIPSLQTEGELEVQVIKFWNKIVPWNMMDSLHLSQDICVDLNGEISHWFISYDIVEREIVGPLQK